MSCVAARWMRSAGGSIRIGAPSDGEKVRQETPCGPFHNKTERQETHGGPCDDETERKETPGGLCDDETERKETPRGPCDEKIYPFRRLRGWGWHVNSPPRDSLRSFS